jgi:hypothetical protein
VRALRFALVGTIAVGSLALSACGGSSGAAKTADATGSGSSQVSASAEGSSATGAVLQNAAPAIQGSAITTATVGTVYSFQPQATDPNNDPITFSIANKPAWATFNQGTGQLSGTPTAADVGSYANIEISATDGKDTVSLPAFSLTVSAAAAGASSVNLSWVAPTENSDGSPLTDLKGFKIHYGTESQNYTGSISVDNPSLTTYLVSTLPAGKYYFAVTAYNSAGLESDPSDEIAATFN